MEFAFDHTVHPDDARPAGKLTECFYCNRGMGADHAPDCVVIQIRRLEAAPIGVWQPIETYQDGDFVLFWFPHGEKGVGGRETAMAWRDDDGVIRGGWSHGGPNSGLDFTFGEPPTKWARLPDPPD